MQPESASELQDSSDDEQSFEGESFSSITTSDTSSESDIEDPGHPESEWTAKNGQWTIEGLL